jgi:glycosyltransferase involved in cell wall biosynthesis
MIVKNESALLDRCLTSARPFVDEIVVVDTGSTDGTQDIARRHADVYREIEWPGSFSDARNFSIEQASGSHVLILDGDEYIDEEHAGGWARVRAQALGDDVAAALLPIHNLFQEDALLQSERMWQERIYRNTPEIRYSGRVHNQIGEAIHLYATRTDRRIVRIEAPVTHLGYAHATGAMRDKYTPRIALLEAEIADAPTPEHRAYYVYQLATVYVVMQEWERVLDIFDTLEYDLLAPHNRFYSHMLTAQAATYAGRPARALEQASAMLSIERGEPMAYFYAALSLLAMNRIVDGMLFYTQAMRVNQQRRGLARFNLHMPALLRRTATLCRSSGHEAGARLFERLAQTPNPNSKVVLAALDDLQAGIVRSDPTVAPRRAPRLELA